MKTKTKTAPAWADTNKKDWSLKYIKEIAIKKGRSAAYLTLYDNVNLKLCAKHLGMEVEYKDYWKLFNFWMDEGETEKASKATYDFRDQLFEALIN